MSAEKRLASDAFTAGAMVVKQQKPESNSNGSAVALASGSGGNGALIQSVSRTSGLQAPVMELSGHDGEVFATRFSPSGAQIASGSFDRRILLWKTYGDCENYAQLIGHKAAVLDLAWSRDSLFVFSASADATVASWDLETGRRIRRHEGHTEIVNSLALSRRGEELIVSGSDDGAIGLWDPRMKYAAAWIESDFPVTAVAIPTSGHEIYSGGIDNDIKVWDIRKKTATYKMAGHQDTVTSLEVSPDDQALLSYAYDSSVRTWDVRPFAPMDRCTRVFDGAQAGLDKNLARASWDPKGERVAASSGDGTAIIWETRTGRLLAKLPGHRGSVNDVRFEPTGEPVVLSGGTDKRILLGELGK